MTELEPCFRKQGDTGKLYPREEPIQDVNCLGRDAGDWTIEMDKKRTSLRLFRGGSTGSDVGGKCEGELRMAVDIRAQAGFHLSSCLFKEHQCLLRFKTAIVMMNLTRLS